MFNDVISLKSRSASSTAEMIETGIAWQSDIEYKFKQPDGFEKKECAACDDSCCAGDYWSCNEPYIENGTCWSYTYPDDDTTQYLYETYPNVISPIQGVENEHFIVWMRVATLSNFRKLYGWIDTPILANETLEFEIQNNWEINSFSGTKSLVLSTTNYFGGKNSWMGPFFYGVGFFSVGAATFFSLKQLIRPRRIGDPKYLQLKED